MASLTKRALVVAMLLMSLTSNVLLAGLCVILWRDFKFGGAIGSMATADGLLNLEPGDSCAKIVRTVGYPIRIVPGGIGFNDPRRQEAAWPEYYSWIYARTGVFQMSPRIMVGMKSCELIFVSVKAPDDRIYYKDYNGVRGTLGREGVRDVLRKR